jgi:hypothetical protein
VPVSGLYGISSFDPSASTKKFGISKINRDIFMHYILEKF